MENVDRVSVLRRHMIDAALRFEENLFLAGQNQETVINILEILQHLDTFIKWQDPLVDQIWKNRLPNALMLQILSYTGTFINARRLTKSLCRKG